jgi:hypothetical protein
MLAHQIPLGSLFLTDTDERFTPQPLINKIKRVLGQIDLDPCTSLENPVKARIYYTKVENGLGNDWWDCKSIYLNPPTENSDCFVNRLITELADNDSFVEVAIACINYSQHLNNLHLLQYATLICFPFEKINWKYIDNERFCEDQTAIALFTKYDVCTALERDLLDINQFNKVKLYRSRFTDVFGNFGLITKPIRED